MEGGPCWCLAAGYCLRQLCHYLSKPGGTQRCCLPARGGALQGSRVFIKAAGNSRVCQLVCTETDSEQVACAAGSNLRLPTDAIVFCHPAHLMARISRVFVQGAEMAHAAAGYTGAKPKVPRLLTSAVLAGLGHVGCHTDLPRTEVAGLIHVNPAAS